MANRSKLPLHLLKEVGRYLDRDQLEKMRLVCKIWNKLIATRPSYFRQRRELRSLYCDVVSFRMWITTLKSYFSETKASSTEDTCGRTSSASRTAANT